MRLRIAEYLSNSEEESVEEDEMEEEGIEEEIMEASPKSNVSAIKVNRADASGENLQLPLFSPVRVKAWLNKARAERDADWRKGSRQTHISIVAESPAPVSPAFPG